MALSSPGVEVKVIDESFYTPAEPGTVPMIVIASAQDKSNSAGDGTAPGTLKANAGRVYLLTSQKDLGDTFGDPVFKTDASNNPIHAGEQNEYGLQAAYSLLGVSNRAYVVRADLDLAELDASASAPAAEPNNGTYWLDVDNTNWGIFEWNGDAATVTGGQTFTNKIPLVITDPTKVNAGTGGPASSVGKNGSYAIVAVGDDVTEPDLTTVHPMTVWYRNNSGTWVQVGSTAWDNSWTGTVLLSMAPHTSVPQWKTGDLNAPTGSVWIKTTEPNLGARWRAKRYNSTTQLFEQIDAPLYSDPTTALFKLDKLGGGANLAAGQLYVKYNATESSPQQADFAMYRRKSAAPTTIRSSKVTASTFAGDAGALTSVTTLSGTSVSAAATYTGVSVGTVSGTGLGAVATVTKTGSGTTYISSNTTVTITSGGSGYQSGNTLRILGTALGGLSPANDLTFVVSGESTSYTFSIAYTEKGSAVLTNDAVISFTITTPGVANAATVATAINTLLPTGSPVEASVDNQNRLQLVHEEGGDVHLLDGTNGPLAALGFAEYEPSTGNGTLNLYVDPDADHGYVASLWEPLTYSANSNPPTSLTADGTLWYSSVVDEIDIMVHDGNDWVGYLNAFPSTDSTGPLVSATKPETQLDGSPLETGDLWVDSSDTENWGTVYRFNKDLLKWFLVDKSDQSTEDGMLFADARYNTAGATSDEPATIEELLTSNFLDFDAPDPALYPKGMLLWNTRRSGFNVKEFRQNYIDVDADNIRNGDESMSLYYPHRWVTVSSNQDDGSGTFGRKAQRKVVVRALQATVNSNQEIRDEESRVFNLLACPGYPELIGELITLNYDRGLTAFVVGDTPARLTPDATSLLAWGTNQRLALEDNDLGGVSYDEYMGMFYPWGFTSDNFGNNVVVPPSHMILRTIALNDQVAYPWFAPAGVRRGGITNATAVGYVTSEGEFASVALNNGQRDTLYEAKINPITFLTGTGLVNYGQKTRAKAASALDRINVARLVIYLRRQLSALAKPYIFEPNDKITRDQVKSAAESLMLELVGQRALYDYIVVCDESNNTPARIDRNELYLDIAIEPVKAVEFIYIPLRLKNTGEIAALG
jgi:hypothetical protein